MKKIEDVLKQNPVYLNNWKENGKIGVISDFDDIYLTKEEFESAECPYPNKTAWEERKQKMTEAIKRWDDVNILFASYGSESYEGDAFVLFERNGKLFEVNGSHCSCMGLEGQFEPEETFLEALEHRLVEGKMGNDNYAGNNYATELKEFLGIAQ